MGVVQQVVSGSMEITSRGPQHRDHPHGVASSRRRHNCRHASQVQSRDKYKHVIRLVDVDGNVSKVVTRGRLNTTSHQSVLASLLHCAEHAFQARLMSNLDGHHAWSHDKTSTIARDDILCVGNNFCFNEVQRNEVEEINRIDAPKEILILPGSTLPKKPNGIVWLIYENANGLGKKFANNNKVKPAKEIHNDLEVDTVAYTKHQLNMWHARNVNGFNQLFCEGEAAICPLVTHNVHENIGWRQKGGTNWMLFGPLIEQLDMNQSGKDNTGLGR
jgi:hypothetical protein